MLFASSSLICLWASFVRFFRIFVFVVCTFLSLVFPFFFRFFVCLLLPFGGALFFVVSLFHCVFSAFAFSFAFCFMCVVFFVFGWFIFLFLISVVCFSYCYGFVAFVCSFAFWICGVAFVFCSCLFSLVFVCLSIVWQNHQRYAKLSFVSSCWSGFCGAFWL